MPAQHQPKPGLELKDFNQKWHHHMRALEERSLSRQVYYCIKSHLAGVAFLYIQLLVDKILNIQAKLASVNSSISRSLLSLLES